MQMPKGGAVVLAILVTANPGASCDKLTLVCGTGTGACTATADYLIGTGPPCVVSGSTTTFNGQTAQQLCAALAATMTNDCAGCGFTCAPTDNGCYLLGNPSACADCVANGSSGSGCGFSVTQP